MERMKPTVHALVLDIGEILLRIDFSRLVAALALGEGTTVPQALAVLNRFDLYDHYERGRFAEAEFRERLAGVLGRRLPEAEFLEIWNSVIVGAIDGIEPILETLERQIPLYALSNTNETHMRHVVARYPWLSRFRKIFTSHELGARKPETEIYEKVAREIGLAPQRLLFVDDRPENVRGARRAGYLAEVCKESPSELLAILRRHGLWR